MKSLRCYDCDGEGERPLWDDGPKSGVSCETCAGTGLVSADSDSDAQAWQRMHFVENELRTRVQTDRDRLLTALKDIAGNFVDGQRNTYAPGDMALDKIRATAEHALVRHEEDQEDILAGIPLEDQ